MLTESGIQSSISYTTPAFNVLARFIRIQRPGILTICEVTVREGDCLVGHFGEDCSKICNCLDGKSCDRNTGQCQTPFCKLGWSGWACDRECEAGYFGENCSKSCYCASGVKCTSDYGICPGKCLQGYRGAQCNIDDKTQSTNSLDEKAKQSRNSEKDTTGLIVGSSVSAVIIVLLVAAGIYLWKGRTNRKNTKKNDYKSQVETTLHDYETLDNIKDVPAPDVCYQNPSITGL